MSRCPLTRGIGVWVGIVVTEDVSVGVRDGVKDGVKVNVSVRVGDTDVFVGVRVIGDEVTVTDVSVVDDGDRVGVVGVFDGADVTSGEGTVQVGVSVVDVNGPGKNGSAAPIHTRQRSKTVGRTHTGIKPRLIISPCRVCAPAVGDMTFAVKGWSFSPPIQRCRLTLG